MRALAIVLMLANAAQAADFNDPSKLQFHDDADAELQRLQELLDKMRAECVDAGVPSDRCIDGGVPPTVPDPE